MEATVTTRPPSDSFRRSSSRHVSRKWPRWFTPNSTPKPSSVRPSATRPGPPSRVRKQNFVQMLKKKKHLFPFFSAEDHHLSQLQWETMTAGHWTDNALILKSILEAIVKVRPENLYIWWMNKKFRQPTLYSRETLLLLLRWWRRKIVIKLRIFTTNQKKTLVFLNVSVSHWLTTWRNNEMSAYEASQSVSCSELS